MGIHRIFIVGISLLIAHQTTTFAQVSVHAAGTDAIGTGGSASFSVGQVMYTEFKGQTGSASGGVQQPYTITMVGNIDPQPDISLSVFPNPVQDNDFLVVNINAGFDPASLYTIDISDLCGHRLIRQQLDEMSTAIPVGSFADGLYLLRVLRNGSTIRIFKVVKTH